LVLADASLCRVVRSQAERFAKEHGVKLLNALPDETTNLFMELCSRYHPRRESSVLVSCCPDSTSIDLNRRFCAFRSDASDGDQG
jgi:hypothetical protein